jgi:enoyl ACP reductase
MGLLDGKRLLITGVLTDASLAFAVAKLAQEEGAEVVLSGAGRALSLTRRTARKLPTEPDVLVGLDFDATVAWPIYDWMGVAKAALESLTRYLARDLGPDGIRVNLVAAGPIRTMAAKSIPGFSELEEGWSDRAPLGWDVNDSDVVARACIALFSDLLPMTTGEILHVDGGVHAVR